MLRFLQGFVPSLLLFLLTVSTGPPARAQGLPPPAPPVVELGDHAVTVRGTSPGGDIVLFGVAQETDQHITTIVRRERVLRDHDGDGSETFELSSPVAFTSVWAAVDLATGEASSAVPDGFPRREIGRPPSATPATLDRLDLALPMAEIVLVRPGVGAWGRRAGDGGASDGDGVADGTIRTDLAGMWTVGESPPVPELLAPGDVLVVIDPYDLAIALVRLGNPGESAP